jgi:hypothetical protein
MILQPHGFKERVAPHGNLEHDEVNRVPPDESVEGSEVQL